MVPRIGPLAPLTLSARAQLRANGSRGFGATLEAALRMPSTAVVPALDSVVPVTLATENEEDHCDRTARQHIQEILDELEWIQRDLLRAAIAPSRLQRIAALTANLKPNDPKLADLCASVALRARIEITRLQAVCSVTTCRPLAPLPR